VVISLLNVNLMLKRCVLFVLFTVALSLAAQLQAANDRLLFWEVPTDRGTIWLLGSLHLARADIYPLRREIMSAFESSGTLVVEVDIGGANQFAVQQRMLELGTYPAGKSIEDDLSAQTWKDLQARLDASGLPAYMMMQLKPGLVVTTLTTMEMLKLGLNPELGVDKHFLTLARGSKPIAELETVDQQIGLLLDFPNPNLLVQQTLAQMDGLEATMNELISMWKRGDAPGLRKLVLDDELSRHPEFRPLQERLFDQRNRAMTDRILQMQASGGDYFVVVGAGHLLGDQGIVALLAKRGLKPRQL
jgi:uncharacterized protein YbaP (TraB family)